MQTTEDTMSRDNTTTITSVPQQVIDYLCAKVVDAALTLLRWLYTPEDPLGSPDLITSITRQYQRRLR